MTDYYVFCRIKSAVSMKGAIRKLHLTCAVAFSLAACQEAGGEREYYLGPTDLADFTGSWEIPTPDGLVRFDIRPGSDGRYFGHAVRAKYPDSPAIMVHSVNPFGGLRSHLDDDGDNSRDLLQSCDIVSYGTTMHCEYSTNDAPHLFEATAERVSSEYLVQQALGLTTSSAPAEFGPRNPHNRDREYVEDPPSVYVEDPPSVSAGSGAACWEQAQNRIVADIQPRMSSSPNMCPNARLSVDLWSRLAEAARECGMPGAVVAEAEASLAQSRATVNNVCRQP